MKRDNDRARRRSADLRPKLLAAAAAQFAAKGYSSATVADIAQSAEVTTSVLYRHFAGKPDLFKEAVISPLLEALDEYRTEWSAQRSQPYSHDQIWLVFVDDLYRSFAKHRHALIAYISSADQLDPEVLTEIRDAMKAFFTEIRGIAEEEAARRSARLSKDELELALHLVVTMIAGATTLGPLTLQLDDGPVEPSRLVRGMSGLTLWGLGTARPGWERTEPDRTPRPK